MISTYKCIIFMTEDKCENQYFSSILMESVCLLNISLYFGDLKSVLVQFVLIALTSFLTGILERGINVTFIHNFALKNRCTQWIQSRASLGPGKWWPGPTKGQVLQLQRLQCMHDNFFFNRSITVQNHNHKKELHDLPLSLISWMQQEAQELTILGTCVGDLERWITTGLLLSLVAWITFIRQCTFSMRKIHLQLV